MSKFSNDINLAYQNTINYFTNSENDKIISDYDEDDFDITNLSSIINYIYKNKIQFLLLLLVGIIIYFVDYINQINSMLFGTTPFLPGVGYMPTTKNMNSINTQSINISKKTNRIKNR